MTIRTIGDRIAVRLRLGTGKVGAIVIPDATKSTRNQTFFRAEVVSAGSAVRLVKSGDTVIVSEYFGDEMLLDGKPLRIGRERDILGLEEAGTIMPPTNRLLLEVEDAPRMAGALYLPEDLKEFQVKARVVAIGPKCLRELAGSVVLLPKIGTVTARIDDRVYLLSDEPTILAIL